MRHLKSGKKLSRSTAHRSALYRNLVASLLTHDPIRTTDAKAKEDRRFADRMVTQGTLAARRRAAAFVRNPSAVQRLFSDVAPRFADRAGGYTRIVKLGHRPGDAAAMSMIELTGVSESVESTKKKRPRRPKVE